MVGAVYGIFLAREASDSEACTAMFLALVLGVICLILVNRSLGSSILSTLRPPHWILFAALLIVVLAFTGIVAVRATRELFDFASLTVASIAGIAGFAGAVLVLLQFLKAVVRHRGDAAPAARSQAVRAA